MYAQSVLSVFLVFFLRFGFCNNEASRSALVGRPTLMPTPAPCVGPLECLLENVRIGPINLCIDVPSNGTDIYGICFSSMFCGNILLDSIFSDYLSPHSLEIAATGFGIECDGNWNVSVNSSSNVKLLYEGAFSIAMSDTDVNTTMTFSRFKNDDLPSKVTFEDCNVTSVDFEIHFIGGAIGNTLDKTLAPALETALEGYTEALICDLIGPLIGDALSLLLIKQVNPSLKVYVDAANEPYVPPKLSGYYDWNTSPLATIHNLLGLLGNSESDVLTCFLNATDSSGNDDIYSDLPYIDKLINLLTNSTGVINIPVQAEPLYIGNSTNSITIQGVSISGLNTFNDITIMAPSSSSNVILTSSIGLDSLSIDINALVNLTNGDYLENIIINLAVSDISLTIDLMVALNEEILYSLYMGQLMESTGCVATALDYLEVTYLGLLLNVDEISIKQISNGDATELEQDMVELIDNFFELIIHTYPLTDIIAGIAQTNIRSGINVGLNETLQSMKTASTCLPFEANNEIEYIAWASSDLISTLNTILNDLIGVDGINSLMTCITNGTGNLVISISSDTDDTVPSTSTAMAPITMLNMDEFNQILESKLPRRLKEHILTSIQDHVETSSGLRAAASNETSLTITLGGLNTFFKFALLYPITGQPYNLGNSIGLGYCEDEIATPENGCVPFSLTLSGILNGREIYLSVQLLNMDLFINLLMMLDMNALEALTVEQFNTAGCKMTAVDTLQVYDASILLTEASLVLKDGDTVLNITDAVTTIIESVEGKDGITSKINANFEESIANSDAVCDGSYDPDNNASTSSSNGPAKWTWQLALLLVGCVLSLLALTYIYYRFGTKGAKQTISKFFFNVEDDDDLTQAEQRRVSEVYRGNHPYSPAAIGSAVAAYFGYPDYNYDALVANYKIPLYVRLLFPVVILFNIALFLTANIQVGTSVIVTLNIGSKEITPDPIFDFGLANTVRDMWDAGIYPLSIMVAFFSGAWPYVKLASMMVSKLVDVLKMGNITSIYFYVWMHIYMY